MSNSDPHKDIDAIKAKISAIARIDTSVILSDLQKPDGVYSDTDKAGEYITSLVDASINSVQFPARTNPCETDVFGLCRKGQTSFKPICSEIVKKSLTEDALLRSSSEQEASTAGLLEDFKFTEGPFVTDNEMRATTTAKHNIVPNALVIGEDTDVSSYIIGERSKELLKNEIEVNDQIAPILKGKKGTKLAVNERTVDLLLPALLINYFHFPITMKFKPYLYNALWFNTDTNGNSLPDGKAEEIVMNDAANVIPMLSTLSGKRARQFRAAVALLRSENLVQDPAIFGQSNDIITITRIQLAGYKLLNNALSKFSTPTFRETQCVTVSEMFKIEVACCDCLEKYRRANPLAFIATSNADNISDSFYTSAVEVIENSGMKPEEEKRAKKSIIRLYKEIEFASLVSSGYDTFKPIFSGN